MGVAGTPAAQDGNNDQLDVPELMALVRRVVHARVPDPVTAEDLVQETLVRVLAVQDRVATGMQGPYAIVTARNLVSSRWRQEQRERRNEHRLADVSASDHADEQVLRGEDQHAMGQALARLPEQDRQSLLAHEVEGRPTTAMGSDLGVTPGAVAARLHRARARLRVEYLLSLERLEPATEQCRPVLLAISAADRRRQNELDAPRHLLECDVCGRITELLVERSRTESTNEVIAIRRDADIVAARQAVRRVASAIGFSRMDATVIATAVSEIARNIVRFAEKGDITVKALYEGRRGIHVTARDVGPGIPDVEQAIVDGYSTYRGLGLGLPGARRLMDEFAVSSVVGRGTTVTMVKWWKGPEDD